MKEHVLVLPETLGGKRWEPSVMMSLGLDEAGGVGWVFSVAPGADLEQLPDKIQTQLRRVVQLIRTNAVMDGKNIDESYFREGGL